MLVGVLAVQGAFREHREALAKLGVATKEIRHRSDLDEHVDGLIFPGGESTAMGKLLHELQLFTPLQKLIKSGTPVLGTCAGMILLAGHIEGTRFPHLGTMDICVKRNAYGRQLGSFNTKAAFGNVGQIEMIFIRAPYISQVSSSKVEILAEVDGHMVAARQGNQLVTAFHPELSNDMRIHSYFVEMLG
ncbi:MAG: pyridoxal 5'-phosphate synthase glutaminase subunit PdxT [Pseudomonadota bacterium]